MKLFFLLALVSTVLSKKKKISAEPPSQLFSLRVTMAVETYEGGDPSKPGPKQPDVVMDGAFDLDEGALRNVFMEEHLNDKGEKALRSVLQITDLTRRYTAVDGGNRTCLSMNTTLKVMTDGLKAQFQRPSEMYNGTEKINGVLCHRWDSNVIPRDERLDAFQGNEALADMRDIYWATVDGLVPVRRTVTHQYAKAVSDFSSYTVLTRPEAGALFAIPNDVECVAPEPGAAGSSGAPPEFGEEEEEEGYEGEDPDEEGDETDEGYDGEHGSGSSEEDLPEDEEVIDEEGHAVGGGSGAPHTDL